MISIIAAVGNNLELGKDNDLIWHLKGDLKHFKDISMGKKVVMGSNTYFSLPKRLEGREYIILSNPLIEVDDAVVFDDFNKLLEYVKGFDEEILIIGGASIYKLFVPFADKMYLTEIDDYCLDADVYFPSFEKKLFNKTIDCQNEENGIKYKFVTYERKHMLNR